MDRQTEKVAAAGTDRQAEKESVLESMDPMVMAVGGVAVAYVDGSYNVATGEYGAGVAFFSEQGEEHISRNWRLCGMWQGRSLDPVWLWRRR